MFCIFGVPDQTLTIETATTTYATSFDSPAGYDGSELTVAIDEEASTADLNGSDLLASNPVRCEAETEPPTIQPSAIDPSVVPPRCLTPPNSSTRETTRSRLG